MGLTQIFKTAGKVGIKVAKVGDLLDVPVLSQIDTALQIIQNSKAEDHDKAAATVLLEGAKATPIIAPDGATDGPVSPLESKRFLMIIVGIAALVLTHVGWLPKELADEITPYVLIMILSYLGI